MNARLRACPTPPPKREIFHEVTTLAVGGGVNMGISAPEHISADWLLVVLATVDPDHKFFAKDYYPRNYQKQEE